MQDEINNMEENITRLRREIEEKNLAIERNKMKSSG